MKNRGFTFIEVMVVLTFIGLSVLLVTPSLSRFSKTVELKGAAKKISAILRYCRSEAVNRDRVYQVLFDPDLRQVQVQTIEEKEEEDGTKAETKDSTKDGAREEMKPKMYALPKGVVIKEVKFNTLQYPSDNVALEFYPSGGSNGGTILLDSADRKGYRIKVHFLTGIVEIEKV